MKAIETISLSKTYPNGKKALDALNLTVESGEIFSLLGTNGVGKSTLINILTTFLKPTAGNAFIMGRNVEKEAAFVRTQVACVAQSISVDNQLTLHENMVFQGRLYGLTKTLLQEREKKLLQLFDLEEYTAKKAGSCSGGIKRRLDVAMSMLSEPKILFLDEPTVGMDIQSRHVMWSTLEKLKSELGITIFLTTHYLEEADYLSDTICFVADGKKLLQGSPASLRQYTQNDVIRIATKTEDMAKDLARCLEGNPFIQRSYCKGTAVYLQVSEKEKALQDIGTLAFTQAACVGIEMVEPTLEDIFIQITGSNTGGTHGNI